MQGANTRREGEAEIVQPVAGLGGGDLRWVEDAGTCLVCVVGVGQWLGLMVTVAFSNLNDSMTLG